MRIQRAAAVVAILLGAGPARGATEKMFMSSLVVTQAANTGQSGSVTLRFNADSPNQVGPGTLEGTAPPPNAHLSRVYIASLDGTTVSLKTVVLHWGLDLLSLAQSFSDGNGWFHGPGNPLTYGQTGPLFYPARDAVWLETKAEAETWRIRIAVVVEWVVVQPSPAPPPDFSLRFNPETVSAVQGETKTTTFEVVPFNGFAGSVECAWSWSGGGSVYGVAYHASPSGPYTLTLVAPSAWTGFATVQVTCTSGSVGERTAVLYWPIAPRPTRQFVAGPTYYDIPQYGVSRTASIAAGQFRQYGADQPDRRLNSDKFADFLKVYSNGNAYAMLGSGSGSFTSAAPFWDIPQYGPPTTSSIVFGDFNGDGQSDFLKVYANGVAYVVHSKGNGTFGQCASSYSDIPQYGLWSTSSLLIGDFNGDRRTDLLTVYSNGSAAIHLSTGNCTFARVAVSSVVPGFSDIPQVGGRPTTQGVVVADFNGDGKDDLLKVYADGGAYAMFSQGDGRFVAGPRYFDIPQYAGLTRAVGSIAAGDFNGDGRADLIKLYTNGRGYALFSLGDGRFLAGPAIAFDYPSLGDTMASILVRDFNADGRADLMVRTGVPGSVGRLASWTSNGDGTFGFMAAIPSSNTAPDDCEIADLDGDGWADAFCVASTGHGQVYFSRPLP